MFDLGAVIAPALDAYAAEIGRHMHTESAEGGAVCACGWEPAERVPAHRRRRSVGLHISAAMKRASKVYDVESARLTAEARAQGHAQVRKDAVHDHWGVWLVVEGTWHEGTYPDAKYAAGVPFWRDRGRAAEVAATVAERRSYR